MKTIKTKDYNGYSEVSIDEAMMDALKKTDKKHHIEVIETRSSKNEQKHKSQYQVTLTTADD